MIKKIKSYFIIIVAGILYFVISSAFRNEENTVNSTMLYPQDTFTNCIFNSPYREAVEIWGKPGFHITENIDKYKELNFNSVQWYDWGSDKYGWADSVLTVAQIDSFKKVLNAIDTAGLYGFYERRHISKYSKGQRLIYEIANEQCRRDINYGFVYDTCLLGTYTSDSGRTVLHALPGTNNAGYLCRNIYENLQHSDYLMADDEGMWYIKPVMRIPADTSIHDTNKVVRIEILPFGDSVNPVKTVIIRAENFKDNNGIFDGSYLEKYFRLSQELEIKGKDSLFALNYGRGETPSHQWAEKCKVDFRVYWYGECEVWFDKMIVDDEIANKLFDPDYQSDINDRIKQEVDEFTLYGSNYSFYLDEMVYSMIPCTRYVLDTMRSYNSGARISFALTNCLHIQGLKNDTLSFQVYIDSLKPQIIQIDHHGFFVDGTTGEWVVKIPDVLPKYDTKLPDEWFISPEDYNIQLQGSFGLGHKSDKPTTNNTGPFIYEINLFNNLIKQNPSKEIKLIIQPQIHGWLFGTDNYEYGLREPTNEEIQVQAMISIAHGARGLCWFAYNTHTWDDYHHMIGLIDSTDNPVIRREHNCYGQDKWQYVSEMNEKILKWANVLENTDWKQGYSVHSEGAENEYISDIKSIKRNSYSPYNFSETNIDTVKYWEEGFFEPKVTSVNNRSKYFLIVNRRCVPEVNGGEGDIRWLKIRFNSSSLSEFRNWKLEDVYTGESLIFNRLDTTSGGYVDLGNQTGDMGYFLPGEGKLFKLAPVMQEGGTLVCDEFLSSGSINCDSTVYNDGFDITINKDVTISFSSKGEIVMEGGEFICGLDPQMSQKSLELKNSIFQNTERKFTDFKSFLFFQYLNVKS